MVDIGADRQASDTSPMRRSERLAAPARRGVPRWVVTVGVARRAAGCSGNISAATSIRFSAPIRARSSRRFVELVRNGKLAAALLQSVQPFVVGYGLAIVIGVPLGLVIGRFWVAEAALGILVTGGYAMPLVALVPLLVLWFGLGFAVKVAVIFLMSVFPICINTWLGVKSVPKTLIDVGKSLVASDARDPAPHRAAGDAALHHGGHPARGRPRRGRHGDRGVLHHHLRASAPSSSTRPTISIPPRCSCRSSC